MGLTAGEGFAAAGRLLSFWLTLLLELLLIVKAGRFEFPFVAPFVLPLFAVLFVAGRFVFPLRFPVLAFAFSFAFLLVFLLRLGLFSFAAAASFVFWFGGFSSRVLCGTASEDSPSLTVLLMSMATVWPVLTTSPARGN